MGGTPTSNTGGSQSHPNVQPSLALTFVIALAGVFPSRS
jgi:microcystin-dependent protein